MPTLRVHFAMFSANITSMAPTVVRAVQRVAFEAVGERGQPMLLLAS